VSAWEIVIGLETHAQLSTRSKMFSGASTEFGAAPNTQASAVDIALPGVLPVANRGAVERALRFGLAVGAKINRRSIFARKNYFYPDLPKGYQISQYELPIVQGGEIPIVSPTRGQIKVCLTRAHLEEDAGKLLHEEFKDASGIDLNRAGVPLLEIVSEPEMRSAEEAVAYAKALHALVRWIDICDGNMQEGSFRCDANVSVRRKGDAKLGTRCEIKNLNSFRFLERAIEFEAKRQIEILEDGGRIVQETRLYDVERDETRSMRTKEDAHDYRYFPDPDLLPLVITEEEIAKIRQELPELPNARRERFVREYHLPLEIAAQLTSSKDEADYFEQALNLQGKPINEAAVRQTAFTVVGEISAYVNDARISFSQSRVTPQHLATANTCVMAGVISAKAEKEVLRAVWEGEGDPETIIEKRGLKQMSDAGELDKIVDEVLAANARQVEDYRAGKGKAFNSLVGQAMKATRGKGNPAQINEILRKKLGR
jgi:aspartyl-tRNA(Asn)/glutamyl-tRNA(Gln) amidotransferase subunit B